MLKVNYCLLVLLVALLGACARFPTGTTSIKAGSFEELQTYLLQQKPGLDEFRLRGPFGVNTRTNLELRLPSGERIAMDVYLSSHTDQAPLVLILHGYDSHKDQHAYQAMHLATWGLHSAAVQLPNEGPWVANGKTLAKLVSYIHGSPGVIDPRIDINRILLAGHSFGGASTAVALAEGAPAIGGILLDPAAISKELPNYLGRIKVPIIVLGADENISEARNRHYFYGFIRTNVSEVSIQGAVHEDAQFPSHAHASTEELQITFVSALTASALSFAGTRKSDYAWDSFSDALKSGKLFNPRRK